MPPVFLLDNPKIFGGNDFRLVGTVGGDIVDAEARIAVVVGMEGGGFAEAKTDAVLVRHVERVHVVVAEINAFQVAHLEPALVERAAFVGVFSVRVGAPTRRAGLLLQFTRADAIGEFVERVDIVVPDSSRRFDHVAVALLDPDHVGFGNDIFLQFLRPDGVFGQFLDVLVERLAEEGVRIAFRGILRFKNLDVRGSGRDMDEHVRHVDFADDNMLEPQAGQDARVLFVPFDLIRAATIVAATFCVVTGVHHDQIEDRFVARIKRNGAAADARQFGDVEIDEIFAAHLLVNIILLLARVELFALPFGVMVAEGDGMRDFLLHENVHEFSGGLFEFAMPVAAACVVTSENDDVRTVFLDALTKQLLDIVMQREGALRIRDLHDAELPVCVKLEFLREIRRDGRKFWLGKSGQAGHGNGECEDFLHEGNSSCDGWLTCDDEYRLKYSFP